MLRCQHNAWIHGIATLVALGAALFFRVTVGDWCWIILAISIVWTAEALNTAFEFLADAASPDFHPLVREPKTWRPAPFLLPRSPRQSSRPSSSGRIWSKADKVRTSHPRPRQEQLWRPKTTLGKVAGPT
jgi:hypothetical protein